MRVPCGSLGGPITYSDQGKLESLLWMSFLADGFDRKWHLLHAAGAGSAKRDAPSRHHSLPQSIILDLSFYGYLFHTRAIIFEISWAIASCQPNSLSTMRRNQCSSKTLHRRSYSGGSRPPPYISISGRHRPRRDSSRPPYLSSHRSAPVAEMVDKNHE